MPTPPTDLMSLDDVIATWGHARSWWYTQINAGQLTVYKAPGDRTPWLSRAAVETFLQPRPKAPGEPDAGTGTNDG